MMPPAIHHLRYVKTVPNALAILQVVLPSEINNIQNLDIISLYVYLSLYRHAEFLKDGAPLCFPDKAVVYGPGITGDNVIPEYITYFDVDCRKSGLGDLIVKIYVDDEKVG